MGRRPWRCRCGLPYWWPPVLADAVAVRRGGVRPCGWCTGWRSLPLVSVRRGGGRSVVVSVRGRGGRFRGPWRPFGRPLVHWSAVGLSWPVAARLGLVCLPYIWQYSAAACGPSPLVCGAGPCVPCVRRRWSRWPCRWPSLLVSLVSVSLRRAVARGPCRWPPVWAAVWRCAGGVIAPCRGGPCAVAVRPCWCPPWRSLAVSVRPCWCAGVRSVAGVRFLPCSVAVVARLGRRSVLVSVAGPCGPCGPCFGPCRLAGRVGLASGGGGGWRCLRLRWCLPCQRAAARGWLAVGRVRCFPWWWRPLALLAVLAGVAPAAAVAARLIKGPTPAAAVAALLVVCVTCLRWRRRRWRRWSRPCASRPTCGGRRSACHRCGILTRRQTGLR